MDWISTTIVILSLILSVLAWIAKIRWSNEYKEVKEAQIQLLKEKVNHYKELNSPLLIEHFKTTKQEFENNYEELKKKLATEREKSKSIVDKSTDKEKLNKALHQNEVLKSEISHRVKNSLAIISSIIDLQVLNSNGEISATEMQLIQTRIRSIALAHEYVYDSVNFTMLDFDQFSTYLAELNNLELSIDNDVNDSISINMLVPLSILLNEIFYELNNNKSNKIKVFTTKKGKQIIITIKPYNDINLIHLFKEDNFSNYFINVLSTQMDANLKFEDSIYISFENSN